MPAEKNEVKTSTKAKSTKKNFLQKAGSAISTFFKNIFAELKKATWPTKKELLVNTLSVFAVCIAVGIIIGVSDALLELLVRAIRSIG